MARRTGGPRAEDLIGGPGRDALFGRGGADSLFGAGGRDRLRGGAGADLLDGGAGDDRLEGGRGSDRLFGGPGDDTLIGGPGRGDVLAGGPGDDLIRAGGPGALAMPGLGADTVAGHGDTSLSYADLSGPVRVDLGAGTARGEGVADRLSGLSLVLGSAGDDTLLGGGRRDWQGFSGGPGDDLIDGRGGHDEVIYALARPPSGVRVDLAAGLAEDGFGGTDRLRRIEAVTGTLHDDVLKGGGAPFESFAGLAGDDVIRGRGGADRVDHSRDHRHGGTAGVVVDLGAGTAVDGFGDRDRLFSIEVAIGTRHADSLRGGARHDRLQGGAGRDTLEGGAGRDRLEGGPGRDLLTGGAGRDVFERGPGDGRDRILDFRPGRDRLRVEDADVDAFHLLALVETPRGLLLRLGPGDAVLFDGLAAGDLGPDDVWLL